MAGDEGTNAWLSSSVLEISYRKKKKYTIEGWGEMGRGGKGEVGREGGGEGKRRGVVEEVPSDTPRICLTLLAGRLWRSFATTLPWCAPFLINLFNTRLTYILSKYHPCLSPSLPLSISNQRLTGFAAPPPPIRYLVLVMQVNLLFVEDLQQEFILRKWRMREGL